MAEKKKHIKQYEKNKALASTKEFLKEENNDWRVTALFYATMHLLDSCYSEIFPKHNTHEKRKAFISRTLPYKDIIDEYTELENMSRVARYDCIKIRNKDVSQALGLMKYIEEFLQEKKLI